MEKLPLGIQSFREIREEEYLYIDKTQAIFTLIERGKYYFLSRPRRFGKSLTISTIKALFQGEKELFRGLWIENKWDWSVVHPVIHISFSSIGYQDMGLKKALEKVLDDIAESYRIELRNTTLDQKFKELLKALAEQEKRKVVLLIDEYDKPLIDYLDELPSAKENQKALKIFYSIIKDSDPYIQFLLITGVSKFSKVSVFSDLNNLEDITIDRRFSTLTGYTQTELENYFEEYLQEVGHFQNLDREVLLDRIRTWYNGYSWDTRNFVYNPFSILSFFNRAEFQNFWFSTGTPTFLVKLLEKRHMYQFENVQVGTVAFDSYSLEHLETVPILFQTGYLTLKMKDEYGVYTLDYPNKEVKDAMLQHLIAVYSAKDAAHTTPLVVQLRMAFSKNDLEEVISIIKTLFKNIPSQIFLNKAEAYYHSLIYLLFKYLGSYVESEVNSSDGRLDAVVQTSSHVYIFEFKLDKSVEQALTQMKRKDYAAKFRHSRKQLIGVGINFDSQLKSVENWTAIEL